MPGVSDTDGGEVGSARYWPFGAMRTRSGALGCDRLFTGQTRDFDDAVTDANNDGFYFFTSRYYDATIGRFLQPDTIVPDLKNPQALNRYAYGFNNPLKFVDPSGHDPMDPNWRSQFILQHGYAPTVRDRQDRQFSLAHPGSGPSGGWTELDWQSYYHVRAALGPVLLGEVGRPRDVGTVGGIIAGVTAGAYVKGVPWIDGPDGTRIYLGGAVPHGAAAWTFGNNIIIGKGTIDQLISGQISLSWYRALIIHEYVHVLQYRHLGAAFLPDHVAFGVRDVLQTGDLDNLRQRG
jgi:RHS repeat-associated protein